MAYPSRGEPPILRRVEPPAPTALPHAEALAIIGLPKAIVGDVVWQETPPGSEFFIASFPIVDPETQATIPGLSVELVYRRGVVQGECKSLFTVFSFKPPKLRAYQLEVVPNAKISHREAGVVFKGPHRHIGDKADQAHLPSLPCDDHRQWFEFFLKDAQIKHIGNWKPPQPPVSQLPLEIE